MARNNVDSNDECERLIFAAMNGDWKSVEDIKGIQRKITTKEETTLHIAAAANQEKFVKNLLKTMETENLTEVNNVGNTALTYAAATGNVNIARAMIRKNKNLPNLSTGVKPLRMAASSGHEQMVVFLYSKTKVSEWTEDEQNDLFITCVEGDLYGVALKMLEANSNLAIAKKDGETALHVLARNPSAFVSETQSRLMLQQENLKQIEANILFDKCLQAYRGHVENPLVIPHVLFDAANVGNIECLIKLIRFDFDLLWKRKENKSIFHVAVEKRHESIFNLLNEIGSIGNLIIDQKDGSNMLHLAAELAPEDKLNAISGAALQMQREILWFKEVEKVVPPAFKEMKNGGQETPYVLFKRTHKELRTKGEKWMTDTANCSMVISTLIGSIMFSGLIADGLDDGSNLYLAFSISSAIALFSSSTSLVFFLSILTSHYSYEDFLARLPTRLLYGVATLCISIAAMMVAFLTSFRLKNLNRKELPVIFDVIGFFACVPILLYVLLMWDLFVYIARSTFFQYKPRQHLLYKEVSHGPANPPIQELGNLARV